MSYTNENYSGFYEDFVEQQNQINQILEMLMKKQQETDKRLQEMLDYNSAARSESTAIEQGKENIKEVEIDKNLEDLSLLPVFSSVAKKHMMRVDNLERKRAVKADKIERNQQKIAAHESKVKRLEDINKFLAEAKKQLPYFLGDISLFYEKIIKRNEHKIKSITEEKIPAREEKIKEHKTSILRLDDKIELSQCKLDRCVALSGIVKSFATVNFDEHTNMFNYSLRNFHDASLRLNECKIDLANSKLDVLCESYDAAKTNSERYDIKEKQDRLHAKIKKLVEQNKKLSETKDSEKTADIQKVLETKDAIVNSAVKGSVGEISDAVIKATTENTEKKSPEKSRSESMKNEQVRSNSRR